MFIFVQYNYKQEMKIETMANTEAMKKARAKYTENTKMVGTAIQIDIYQKMLEYCEQKDITKKAFIEAAIAYYLDRH